MNTDLYAALDVPRTADAPTVRKAYRRAAKKAHPDAGGSREAFALIQLALDCLTDADRRAHYDRTGDAGQADAQTLDSTALQIITQVMWQAVTTLVQQNQSPGQHDLIKAAKEHLHNETITLNAQLSDAEKTVAQARDLAARFTPMKGHENMIGPLFETRARDAERVEKEIKNRIKIIERAQHIVADHTFRFDPAPPQAQQVTISIVGIQPNGQPIYAQVWR